jgi:cytochrome c-type biogenesis protein CcmH
MGQPETAEKLLKQALASQQDYAEGYLHLALVYARTGRAAEAERVLKDAEARFPQDAAHIRRAAEEISRVPVADEATAAAHAPAEAAGPHVSGRVEWSGPAPAGAVLFVTARAAGQTAGPPAAAKRLPAAHFPVSFSLSAADSMLGAGQALPDKMRIEARLDSDGDPLTRPPTDPRAALDGVTLGTTGLKLVLAAQ